jgi:hypothetical protein
MPSRPRIPAATRREVARRAGYRCSYCRSPEIVGIPMAIDHVIPLTAGGSSEGDNLCLSCYRCNEFKHAHIDALDPLSGERVSLFRPSSQVWNDHFSWSDTGLHIDGRTAVGRATIEALRLNNEWIVQARRIWILAGLHPPLD